MCIRDRYERVRRGRVALPDHRHSQTQHLMAQLALQEAGYHELPNDCLLYTSRCV